MSAFGDVEYEEMVDEVRALEIVPKQQNGQRHSLNTVFTPLRESPTDFNRGNSVDQMSGISSPTGWSDNMNNSTRRSSLQGRRASLNGAPSEDLLRTTAARQNDEDALREKQRTRSPSYLNVSELPSNSHLLSSTKARDIEETILEEARQRRKSPTRGFKIAHEDFQVGQNLLRPTQSRKADWDAIKAAKQPAPPSFKIAPPDFQPSSRLLKPTKERLADKDALDEKKNGRRRPSGGKKVPKDYQPGPHLVKPTQAFISSQNAIEFERNERRNEKDIWWDERRPRETARSRPNTPSKLRSPTKAFLMGKRDKAPISQSIFATPEEAIAYAPPPSIPPPAPITDDSHLLKSTRAHEMGKAFTEVPEEFQPKNSGLDLVSRRSFRKNVDSKLTQPTIAYEAGKYGADLHPVPDESTKEKVHSPSDRLLALNTNLQHNVREKAEIVHHPREEGWNLFTAKEKDYPSPSNRKPTSKSRVRSQQAMGRSVSTISVGYDDPLMEEDFDDEEDDGVGGDAPCLEDESADVQNIRSPSSKKQPVVGNDIPLIPSPNLLRRSATQQISESNGLPLPLPPQPVDSKKKSSSPTTPASARKSNSSNAKGLSSNSSSKAKTKAQVAAEAVQKAMSSIREQHQHESNQASVAAPVSPSSVASNSQSRFPTECAENLLSKLETTLSGGAVDGSERTAAGEEAPEVGTEIDSKPFGENSNSEVPLLKEEERNVVGEDTEPGDDEEKGQVLPSDSKVDSTAKQSKKANRKKGKNSVA